MQHGVIAGVDEAGRGPLFGPVFAACVVFRTGYTLEGLTDSKQLSVKKRDYFFDLIQEKALDFSIARAEAHEIDALNILEASLLAMQRALAGLTVKPEEVWVDGLHCPSWPCGSASVSVPIYPLVKGDARLPAIAAASVLAKVARDRILLEQDALYPLYGFASHKGYPTAVHLAAIRRHGVLKEHRRSFGPVRQVLEDAASGFPIPLKEGCADVESIC